MQKYAINLIYPDYEVRESMSKVTFDDNKCKGCKLCIEVCPKKIIEIDENKFNNKGFHPAGVKDKEMEKCIGCAFCATICPDCVIIVEKQFNHGGTHI